MKLLLLLLLLPLLLALMPIIIHASTLNIYYNGTVEAEINSNDRQFFLIGYNITDLKVIGARYNITGNTLYLNPINSTVYIYYKSELSKGVIQVNEPYNLTINLYLPLNSSINYISTQPYSFSTVNGLYNITFVNVSKVTLLYASSHVILAQNEFGLPAIIGGLVGSDAVLATLILLLWKRRRKEEVEIMKDEEGVDLVTDKLDERDAIVLEAIKMGTNTLADIVRQTGLPKSTAYRRVKKLVKLGYIEEIREEGKVRYIIKSDNK
ncbi:helix-turn-helix domain-containing protein [Sulfolobus tengchongensis]|uniref:Helix-turn-helix domain-containing protein n=1 Tax=Sulfolobus tengchongensis TaxID=207809 RepID=A0AAX4KZF9_9CREN